MTGEKFELDTEEGVSSKEMLLSYLGANSVPFVISVYPSDFDSKEEIVKYLDKYNEKEIAKYEPIAESYLKKIVENVKSSTDPRLMIVDPTLQEKVPDEVNLNYKDGEISGIIKVGNSEFLIDNNKIISKNGGVTYSDMAATMVSLSGSLMDAITYVLIAFSSISLVVSSIMIGIITYISVLERTKEIGILRALGARKKDISRIFNSETILVGFFAGLLGVFISWCLTFPISAIIKAVAGGAVTTNLAMLEFGDAAWLVIVSTLLTTIAGTVPARIASKKDPVRCLRSE